jgi:hypothetical protein
MTKRINEHHGRLPLTDRLGIRDAINARYRLPSNVDVLTEVCHALLDRIEALETRYTDYPPVHPRFGCVGMLPNEETSE